jgi:hypothetical protein
VLASGFRPVSANRLLGDIHHFITYSGTAPMATISSISFRKGVIDSQPAIGNDRVETGGPRTRRRLILSSGGTNEIAFLAWCHTTQKKQQHWDGSAGDVDAHNEVRIGTSRLTTVSSLLRHNRI